MVDFSDLLQRSLATVNDKYARTVEDLRTVVSELRASIKTIANNEFGFELAEIVSDVHGTTFQIYLDSDVTVPNATLVTVAEFHVGATGYPVEIGTFHKGTRRFVSGGFPPLNDIEQIRVFFVEQLSNPESPLIQGIGYAMRKRLNH